MLKHGYNNSWYMPMKIWLIFMQLGEYHRTNLDDYSKKNKYSFSKQGFYSII